jgi:hypothetical protein
MSAAGPEVAACTKLGRLVETLLIDLDVEAARQKLRLILHRFGIARVLGLHRCKISIQPGPIETRLMQVLRSAHESTRPPAHRVAHGAEVSACLRGKKQQNLLRALRDGYVNSLFADLLIPGLRLDEPILWRRVDRTTQKRHHQHIARAFFFGEVGMHPHAVPHSQRCDCTDGQRLPVAGYLGLNTRPIKIEGWTPIRVGELHREEKQEARK